MGYPTINNFDKNIISRTISNLDANVEHTFTHLLNSLLGLIILPRQWNIQGRRTIDYFNKPLSEYPELNYFDDVTRFTNDDGKEVETTVLEFKQAAEDPTTLKKVIDKLRHSIAHQAIRPTKDGGQWEGVIFRNYQNDEATASWTNEYDFQMYLTQEKLNHFARFIANKYLEAIVR